MKKAGCIHWGSIIVWSLLLSPVYADGESTGPPAKDGKTVSPSAAGKEPDSAATKSESATKKDEPETKKPDSTSKNAEEESKAAKKPPKSKKKGPVVPRTIAGSAFDACPSSAPHCALRSALMHQKFGIMEHGNVVEFDRASQELDLAAAQIPVDAAHPKNSVERQIQHLKREVLDLRRAAVTTLFGRFPLIRAFGVETDEDEDLQIRSYVVPGEAYRRAIRSALTQLVKSAAADPLQVVVVATGARDGARNGARDPERDYFAELVDAEARHAFLSVANFQLYPGIMRNELGPVPDWDAPDPAFGPLCFEFLKRTAPEEESRSVMLVLVRELIDDQGDGHWVQAQQRTFYASTLESAREKPKDLENDKVRVSESLTHDRSRTTLAILTALCLLLLTGILAHAALSRILGHPMKGWLRWLAVPASGFLIGRFLTPLIMLALARWLPHPDANFLRSAWWPCTAGGLSLILPAGVFRLVAGAAGRHFPGISCHGRWGTAFVPVALGTCAAWVRPAYYALGADSLHLIAALAITAGLLAFCFGRAIDLADRFPFAIAPVIIVLALVLGAGGFLAAPVVLWSVAACALLTTTLDSFFLARRASPAVADDDPAEASAGPREQCPRTIEQLLLAVNAPRYLPAPEFGRWAQSVVGEGVTHATWVGLVGPGAAGKSAAAGHLIEMLNGTGNDVQVLMGRCTENSPPYQAIREAFASLGFPAGLVASSSTGGEVNSLFERLADELIPFWDFFSGTADDTSGEETSQRDLLGAITNIVHALSSRQILTVFLDDIQWLDEGSLAVVKHLRENFPPGSDARLLVILASRDAQALEPLELGPSIYSFSPPTMPEQVRILERSLGIEKTSAEYLITALGTMSQEDEGMFWVLRAVGEAARDDAFVAGPRGFTLRKRYLTRQRLPVPTEMRTKLEELLRASGPHQPVLECAALLGEQFRVDDLAECLAMDRLNLLQVLRHLDRDLQLLRDVPADPECYSFSSTFLLETVLDQIGATEHHGSPAQSSKLACEYHARIARTLERRTPRTRALSYRIAQHYFQAGPAYAATAADCCLSAARAARREHAFKNARRYIAMAEHAAGLAHTALDLADERRRIDEAEGQSAPDSTSTARSSSTAAGSEGQDQDGASDE